MLVGIGENESWSGEEFNTWSGEESEDAEDLAELEARLYSQYHYQVKMNYQYNRNTNHVSCM